MVDNLMLFKHTSKQILAALIYTYVCNTTVMYVHMYVYTYNIDYIIAMYMCINIHLGLYNRIITLPNMAKLYIAM